MLDKIIELAYKINTERRATVFLDYSGHVGGLTARIYSDGWRTGCEKFETLMAYLDKDHGDYKPHDILAALQEVYDEQPAVKIIGNCEKCHQEIVIGDVYGEDRFGMYCPICAIDHVWGGEVI